jgi:hypothetical protein
MIEREHELSLVRQAELLDLSRASLYYEPAPVSEEDLALMRRMDELHLEFPFAGSRLLRDLLNAYFTPCRATVSRDAGPAFHLMPGHHFTHAGPPRRRGFY